MNIAKIREDLDKTKIVKGRLDYSHKPDMPDDIRLDDDLSLYGVYGIPPKR